MGSVHNPIEQESASSFRRYLPDLTDLRFVNARELDSYEYVAEFRKTRHPAALHQLTKTWEKLLEEPFLGVTADGTSASGTSHDENVSLTTGIGTVQQHLFKPQDCGIDIQKICDATQRVLHAGSESQRASLRFPLNAREWRCWSNPEFLLRPLGLRLEEVSDDLTLLILDVMKTTLSLDGYEKALAAMRINHFLGELVKLPKVMNKYAYNFTLFGEPSTTAPWGK